jgi:hypothetical protein
MIQELHGNDLQIFMSAEVKRLAMEVWPEDVYRAGGDKLVAELEDHGRGFFSFRPSSAGSASFHKSSSCMVGRENTGALTIGHQRP